MPYRGMNYIVVQSAVFIQSSTNERNIISFTKALSHEMKDLWLNGFFRGVTVADLTAVSHKKG